MRHIGVLGIVALICSIGAIALLTIALWNAPTLSPLALGTYIGLLIAAATATLAEVIRRPARISYGLGWEQGYRTATAEFRRLLERQHLSKD